MIRNEEQRMWSILNLDRESGSHISWLINYEQDPDLKNDLHRQKTSDSINQKGLESHARKLEVMLEVSA